MIRHPAEPAHARSVSPALQDPASPAQECRAAGAAAPPAEPEDLSPPRTPSEELDRRPPPARACRSTSLPDPVNQVNPGAIRSPPPEAFPAEHIADPRPLAADRDARPGPRALVGPLQPEHAQGRPADLRPDAEERARRRRARARLPQCRTPRLLGLDRARLVLRRQRRFRHGDRAAHLPDPGRRPDHPAAGQQRRVRQQSTASSSPRPSSPASP